MTQRQPKSPPPQAGGYLQQTHQPLNCLVFIAPLLAACEVGNIFYPHLLAAPQHLQAFLGLFGARGHFLPPLLVVVTLVVWHAWTRRKWHVDGAAVAGMLAESLLWWLPLLGISLLSAKLARSGPLVPAAAAQAAPDVNFTAEVLRGIGAGIYEEFLFRLGAIGLLLLITVDILKAPKKPMVVVAIAAVSALFGLFHFLPGGAAFTWGKFGYYAAAGVYLSVLYVCRGFGIAVGTHAFYNVVVLLLYRGTGGP